MCKGTWLGGSVPESLTLRIIYPTILSLTPKRQGCTILQSQNTTLSEQISPGMLHSESWIFLSIWAEWYSETEQKINPRRMFKDVSATRAVTRNQKSGPTTGILVYPALFICFLLGVTTTCVLQYCSEGNEKSNFRQTSVLGVRKPIILNQ